MKGIVSDVAHCDADFAGPTRHVRCVGFYHSCHGRPGSTERLCALPLSRINGTPEEEGKQCLGYSYFHHYDKISGPVSFHRSVSVNRYSSLLLPSGLCGSTAL
ncbi:hypothetical protein STEG23_034706, partial [Scotinomys teguina]